MNRKETLYIFLGVGKPIVVDVDLNDIDVWLEYVKNTDESIITLSDKLFIPRDNIRAILFSRNKVEEAKVNLKLLFIFSGDSITLSSHIELPHVDLIKIKLSKLWDAAWSIIKTDTDSLLLQTKRLKGVQVQKIPLLSLKVSESSKPDITSSEVEQIV
jgi:hypothetical protein